MELYVVTDRELKIPLTHIGHNRFKIRWETLCGKKDFPSTTIGSPIRFDNYITTCKTCNKIYCKYLLVYKSRIIMEDSLQKLGNCLKISNYLNNFDTNEFLVLNNLLILIKNNIENLLVNLTDKATISARIFTNL